MSDAWNIDAPHQDSHNIPGMMGTLDVTKVHWKNVLLHGKDNFKVERSLLVSVWKHL